MTYDPRIGRLWLYACAGTAALAVLILNLVIAEVVTPWLLVPGFVWCLCAFGGAVLYGFGCLLSMVTKPLEVEEPVGEPLPIFSVQRFSEGELTVREDDLTQEEMETRLRTLWGSVPPAVAEGGEPDEEWKFALGEGAWVIVHRQR